MLTLARHLIATRANTTNFSVREQGGSTCKPQKSFFDGIKEVPPVEAFHLGHLYTLDKDHNKVNLGIGAYRDEDNKSFVLPIVKEMQLEIVQDESLDLEYLPILGSAEFTTAATEFLLGKDCGAIQENRTVSAQTISGTGALRIASEFLCKHMKKRTCYLPNPTFPDHANILQASGFKQIKMYPYWDEKKRRIDFPKLLAALSRMPEGTVVLLQASGHNPTGVDPNKRQWKQIAEMVKLRQLFPLFDAAYQGFATGDPDRDAWGIRYFAKQGIEMLIAQSFSKNMGLYNVRVGNLVVVMSNKSSGPAVASQLAVLMRVSYMTPPAFGSRIVERVLRNECHRAEWIKSMRQMAQRVKQMRMILVERLKEMETPGSWDHIEHGRGMFSLLGLTPEQCVKLVTEKHIYLLNSGRINVCGLNASNVDYVAESINEVVREPIEQAPDSATARQKYYSMASANNRQEIECEANGHLKCYTFMSGRH